MNQTDGRFDKPKRTCHVEYDLVQPDPKGWYHRTLGECHEIQHGIKQLIARTHREQDDFGGVIYPQNCITFIQAENGFV